MSAFLWTSETITKAATVAQTCKTLAEAVERISFETGITLTRDAIDKALGRGNYPTLWALVREGRMRGGSSLSDERIEPDDEDGESRIPTIREMPAVRPEEFDSSVDMCTVAEYTDADLKRLIGLVKNRSLSLEEVCDRLDLSPKRARTLIDAARAAGVSVEIDGPLVGRRPHEESATIHNVVEQAGDSHIFAVVSDIHFGSKYHLRAQLVDFIDKAYARGVRTILVPGDIMDGIYRHGRWELTHHGFDEQANEAADGMPQRDGLQYHAIIGNHDETFEKESGIAVVNSLQDVFRRKGREDFHIYGARGAYVRLRAPNEARGLIVHMWHPLKGPSYALSYGMQKKVEGYVVGGKPDVLLTGHWHQSCFFDTRGVRAMSCGTWQGGGSAFGKSLAGSPSIGGWVIEYALTPGGTVRHFKPDWVAYYEHEEAREVSMC